MIKKIKKRTAMRVHSETLQKLNGLKTHKRETYEDVVLRLIKEKDGFTFTKELSMKP